MIRQPTTAIQAYAWWRASVQGQRPPTYEDEIQCGYFRTRMVRGGPWIPVRIWLDRDIDPETGELTSDEEHRAEINGQPTDPLYAWGRAAGNPISREKYEALVRNHARTPEMAATHVAYQPRGAIRP